MANTEADVPTGGEAEATFEELAQIELDFEDVETQIIAQQYLLSKPLYEKRAAIIKRINNFWPLALEAAPLEIDSCIQPSDSEVFATCFKDFSVTRFEIPADAPLTSLSRADFGEPRSLAFRFEFADNEWFEDKVIEKKFYWRRGADGFTGLVSDPVKIHWKKGKDLTDGHLDAACRYAEAVRKSGGSTDSSDATAEAERMARRIEDSSEGSQSFFSWFAYVGRFIGEDESRAAVAEHEAKRAKARTGEAEMALPDPEDGTMLETAIYAGGEDLANELANTFWPGALSFFTQAQEDPSEPDFEDDDDEEESDEDGMDFTDIRSLVKESKRDEGPPAKRRKA